MTVLIAAISDKLLDSMLESARTALVDGADIVEIRLDALVNPLDCLRKLGTCLPRGRWIATCRSRKEGGASSLDGLSRLELLKKAQAVGAAYMDFEFADAASEGVSLRGTILSAHSFEGPIEDPVGIAERMRSLAPDAVCKLSWASDDISENFKAMDLLRPEGGKRIGICMGEKGIPSRVLAGKFGAFGTFCAPSSGSGTAPGQLTLGEMREVYRVHKLTPDTSVYGVIGSPVAHSLSPHLFNKLFDKEGIDAVHLPLRIDSEEELRRFLDGCVSNEWFGAKGFCVTLPHKTAVLKWAGEGADQIAVEIGAANTISISSGNVKAFNTDCLGAMAALDAAMAGSGRGVDDLPVGVLGAGGVSRAVVAGLRQRGCSVTIYNRSPERAQELADRFNCDVKPWDERCRIDAGLVVNCTSLGMSPNVDQSPLPDGVLKSDMVVFDTIYNPRRTRLLQQAKEAGALGVDGVAMFVQQAAVQYRIWIGQEPDIQLMTDHVTKLLGVDEEPSS